MRSSSHDLRDCLAPLAAIGLDELRSEAALQDRLDTKYLVTERQLAALLERMSSSHRVLEIEGARAFAYRTTYFDTADLLTYREHVQQRRRRFKCRKRLYVDSGLAFFEVKLKGTRGRTVKYARACDPTSRLATDDLDFLRERLLDAYGRELVERLRPTLVVGCRRVTLASTSHGERVTCDVDLRLGRGRLVDGVAVVETKSVNGGGHADRLLRELGVRPVERFSKYLLGIALNTSGVRDNDLRPLTRRYFEVGSP